MANVSAPVTVQRSYLCWVGASVVFALGTIGVVLLSLGQGSVAAGGAIGTVTVVVVIVIVLALAALVVFFAARMRAGRSWARIVLTVLGVIFVLANLPGLVGSGGSFQVNGQDVGSGPGSTIGVVASVITLILLVAALVLQWLPAARPHFAAQPMQP